MQIFHVLFYEPTFNLLIFLYDVIGNLGLAIIVLAVVSRLITWPLTRRQVKTAEKNKVFQQEVAKIKKKYKSNQEKQAQELAKVQAKYLPGQLGGCLNLIFALILLIQVRNVIINLVNQGVHAYNEVAYIESTKIPEDSIKYDAQGLKSGIHTLEYTIVANGNKLDKTIEFAIIDGGDSVKLTEELQGKIDEKTKEQKDIENGAERDSGISLYIKEFAEIKNGKPIIVNDVEVITAFIRPPSNSRINYETSTLKVDGTEVPSEQLSITKGEPMNFSFLGADLSKVATDFGFDDVSTVAPYVIIAVSVGVTQLFSTKVQMGLNPMMAEKKEDEKEKKGKKSSKKGNKGKDDMDFGEILAQSSKQMTYVFPLITTLWSLGFFGAFFPTGVSLFWTGQNTFVIIQELITNKEKTIAKIKSAKLFILNIFNQPKKK
jgi:YidC/Oxa1 family membrane protein insertase